MIPGESSAAPALEPTADALLARVRAVVEEHVRPRLREEGSDVEVVGVDADRMVQVRLLGSCAGCTNLIYPLTVEIEAIVKAHVPAVRYLEAVP